MKLLLITQVVDKKDTMLSFMHTWITAFAPFYEQITVICLKKGEYDLPANVRVLSLGKETGASRFKYVKNFTRYIISERKNYDAIFVHMNQEYVLLGFKFWKFFGKKIYMWRNHHAGNWITNFAVWMCDGVFCTSKFSYTARFKKTTLMPVGINTDVFVPPAHMGQRKKNSILFLARMAPVKKPDLLIEALTVIKKTRSDFSASLYGDALPQDSVYYESLKTKVKEAGLEKYISFYPGVPNDATVSIYGAHDIFVNLSSSGMFDKTIFEAMACGALSLSSNENLRGEIDPRLFFEEGDIADLVSKLQTLMNLSETEKDALRVSGREYVEHKHSLASLSKKLSAIMSV